MLYLPSLKNLANRAGSKSLPIGIRFQVASDLQTVIAKELLKRPTAASERRLNAALAALRKIAPEWWHSARRHDHENEEQAARPTNGHHSRSDGAQPSLDL